MQDISNDELIKFEAKNELFAVTVFTDVDCGYCRKLHDEITTYNEAGITINYAAFQGLVLELKPFQNGRRMVLK